MAHWATAQAMRIKGIPPTTKITLYWLADHMNGETGECFPSLQRLAKLVEVNKSTLIRHLDTLEGLGLITRKSFKNENGGYGSTRYILHLEDLPHEPLLHNVTGASGKTQQGVVAKCNTNLGNNNLGSITNNISTITDEEFEQFWKIYPRRVRKHHAKKSLSNKIKYGAKFDDIMQGARKYVDSLGEAYETKYIPHPSTWLNQERWKDEPEDNGVVKIVHVNNMDIEKMFSEGEN